MGAYQESELADRTDHFGNKTVLSPFFFLKPITPVILSWNRLL